YVMRAGDQLAIDEGCVVRRQGKADAVVVAGRSGDLRVDADHFAAHVDERAARIAAIDGGVGLQEVLEVGRGNRGALARGDDAGSDGLIKSEGRADGEHAIADLRVVGVAELHSWQIARRV